MLVSKNLNDKTYEELMSDALMEIPLYTNEWTNFNPSEPGVNILENLTAFNAIQEEAINEVTPEIKLKLLQMAGFKGRKGKPARILIEKSGVKNPVTLMPGTQFKLGDICFEINKKQVIDDSKVVTLIYKDSEKTLSYPESCDPQVPVASPILSGEPKVGGQLYFCLNRPMNPGEDILFYMQCDESIKRNDFGDRAENIFAKIKWECYTEEGYKEIHVKDNTGCFLVSGELRMRCPAVPMAACPDIDGGHYVFRATLEVADYDVNPKVKLISGPLIEAYQKETLSSCMTFPGQLQVRIPRKTYQGYYTVLCKEEKGGAFKRYTEYAGQDEPGRYFHVKDAEDNQNEVIICFDKRKYGFRPEKLNGAIKVFEYTETMMRRFSLGKVLGYDDQEIELPVKTIAEDSFCVIAEMAGEDGPEYTVVRPGHDEADALYFLLLSNEGKIIVKEAGSFIGASLFVGACATYLGEEGNIRAGNALECSVRIPGAKFINPGPAVGGTLRESVQDVQRRFLRDMNIRHTAVTQTDYENVIKATPFLCIDKVRAIADETGKISIVVKPKTGEPHPKLSATYRKAIMEQIDKVRLLSTEVELLSPAYMGINVTGTIYVKRHRKDANEQALRTISTYLDYVNTDKQFGVPIIFDELFGLLEKLSCVEYVSDLKLFPKNAALAVRKGNDLYLADNVLCYADEINLEIRTV